MRREHARSGELRCAVQHDAGSDQVKLALLFLALGGVAHASPVKPPAGWTGDQAAAVSLAQKLGPLSHFGGLPSVVTTSVYRPAAGGSLFVTKLSSNAKTEERDRAATAELIEVDASMKRAGSAAKSERDARTSEAQQLIASRRWIDTTTGVVTDSRIVVAADAQQLVAVMGECVLAGDAPADVVTACKAALASLDPEIPVAARVPLAIHTATVDASARPAPVPAAGSASGPSLVESGERPSLPPMQIPQDWNRKNRDKLERQYEKATADKPATEPESKPAKSDRDADDLHAAAEDDTKESKS
jgi:hypothetical protein